MKNRNAYGAIRAASLVFACLFFGWNGGVIVRDVAAHWAELLVLLAFFCALLAVAADLADTTESLLDRADRALYAAKNAGRNRVIEISA